MPALHPGARSRHAVGDAARRGASGPREPGRTAPTGEETRRVPRTSANEARGGRPLPPQAALGSPRCARPGCVPAGSGCSARIPVAPALLPALSTGVTDRGWRQHRGLARLIDLLLRLLGCSSLVGGRSRSDVTGLRRAAAVRGYRWQYDHTRRPATWYPAELAASAEMIARGSFDLRGSARRSRRRPAGR
jgi:hypothetical protein